MTSQKSAEDGSGKRSAPGSLTDGRGLLVSAHAATCLWGLSLELNTFNESGETIKTSTCSCNKSRARDLHRHRETLQRNIPEEAQTNKKLYWNSAGSVGRGSGFVQGGSSRLLTL